MPAMSDDSSYSPPPSGGSHGGGEGRPRRRGRRGGRGRSGPPGPGGLGGYEDDAPRDLGSDPQPLPAPGDRRAPLSRYELLHPAQIPGRLRAEDAVEDLET